MLQKAQYEVEYHATPEYRAWTLWAHAKKRAKKKAVPFTISRKFVEHLLSLGNPTNGEPFDLSLPAYHPGSPSLDRFKPELGYTPENVWMLPRRANNGKTDASLQETLRLVAWWSTAKTFGRVLEQEDFHAKRASLHRKLQMLLSVHNSGSSRLIIRAQFSTIFRRVLKNCKEENLRKSPKHWVAKIRKVRKVEIKTQRRKS
jgi:hypothetical protein